MTVAAESTGEERFAERACHVQNATSVLARNIGADAAATLPVQTRLKHAIGAQPVLLCEYVCIQHETEHLVLSISNH